MKNIKLTKVEITEIEVLQNDVLAFFNSRNAVLQMDRFNNLVFMDIAKRLYLHFRHKAENTTKPDTTINLSTSDAVILLYALTSVTAALNQHHTFVRTKYTNLLHQALINLI